MPTKTRSQLAAMSRRKGAQFERHVATAIRPWFPDTTRSRDNGHRTTNYTAPDSGDLAGTGPEFFWSLKNNDGGTNDSASTVGAWFTECQTKAAALHRTGLLVQKRPGYADPLDSWCWLTLGDLTAMTGWSGCPTDVTGLPVRMRLGDALAAFARCGYTQAAPEPALTG